MIWQKYDAQQPPFTLHGLAAGAGYTRLPREMLGKLRPPVARLALESAGGRIRFTTDASDIRICIHLADTAIKTHMTPLNMAGAELFQGEGMSMRRVAVLRPTAEGDVPFERLDGYRLTSLVEGSARLSGKMETCTLYLPTFTEVERVEISLPQPCRLAPAAPYALEKPIVFYGSSITQGACASRPSLIYPAQVCRALDADFVNLGFAGNALGDPELAAYIATLPMTAFVLDYDSNAPTAEHLAATHQPFFEAVRRAQPALPILILSRLNNGHNAELAASCFAVIERTYQSARKAGDDRVALLDGRSYFPEGEQDDCLTDFIHPNDRGFYLMSQQIGAALAALLRAAQ